ncbi:MAG: hypothetical protein ICV72_01550 [Aldersonia sp.]|nr:hypothetical protein [Aldersonia sp.]
MSTTAAFVLAAVVGVVLFVASARRWFGLCRLGELIDVVRTSAVWRLSLLAVWAWVGWHLLAR